LSRVSLLDVNVLVALFDPDHVHHDIAHDWFSDNRSDGWATCPVTENGFVRVLANPGYASTVTRVADLLERLRAFCASGHHVFWPGGVSLRDKKLFNLSLAGGYRHLTDTYLLGLAKSMGGRLVTFDHGVPRRAVVGADAASLEVIAALEQGGP
jgi:uncharacterized protein